MRLKMQIFYWNFKSRSQNDLIISELKMEDLEIIFSFMCCFVLLRVLRNTLRGIARKEE